MSWGKWKRRNKFGAKRTDGFASKKEAGYFIQFKLLEKAGVIKNLECQPRYRLEVNGTKVGTYTPDFRYNEGDRTVVVEVKGYRTEAYVLRSKLFKALYPEVDFKEI